MLHGFKVLSWMGGGAVADGFLSQSGLLADAAGDFGEFPGIGANREKVVCLADQIEGAQGFPDLFVARVYGGNLGSGGDARSGSDGDGANPAAQGGAKFRGLLAVLQLR